METIEQRLDRIRGEMTPESDLRFVTVMYDDAVRSRDGWQARWEAVTSHPKNPLPDMSDEQLAAQMRGHVNSRLGGVQGKAVSTMLENGAWAMMLEAAARLAR